MKGLGASYLSLDTDGRVIRLDSVAKWMGPGYRIGWATAAPALRQKLEFAQFAACLGPSSLAQVRPRPRFGQGLGCCSLESLGLDSLESAC